MKGTMKNQTVKRWYTITVTNDAGDEVDCKRILAESPREALEKAYRFLAPTEK